MNDIFVVYKLKGENPLAHFTIESVWSTRKLAESAIFYHAHDSKEPIDRYFIAERELNKAKKYE